MICICIGCGCDEHQACTLAGGAACSWIHVGPKGLAGICSACVEIYSPSEIEPELNHAESSLEIYGDYPAQGMQLIDGPRERRLILPGDEEFHL